jgi:hypothetical protein
MTLPFNVTIHGRRSWQQALHSASLPDIIIGQASVPIARPDIIVAGSIPDWYRNFSIGTPMRIPLVLPRSVPLKSF